MNDKLEIIIGKIKEKNIYGNSGRRYVLNIVTWLNQEFQIGWANLGFMSLTNRYCVIRSAL